MASFYVKKFSYKLKNGGRTMVSSYGGNVGGKVAQTEYEAKKQCEDWIHKKYPGWEIVDLKIEFR